MTIKNRIKQGISNIIGIPLLLLGLVGVMIMYLGIHICEWGEPGSYDPLLVGNMKPSRDEKE